MEPYQWGGEGEYQFLRDPTRGSDLEGPMAADYSPNSCAKEVLHLITVTTSSFVWASIVIAPSVTARVEES